jgi:hypothetical protein
MSSLNRCVGGFTGSAGRLRLDLVFVGTPSSSSSDDEASPVFELEYPESELEPLDDPELPASCNPPGGVGFASPEPEEDDDPCESPGYGNCCAGLAGAFGAF